MRLHATTLTEETAETAERGFDDRPAEQAAGSSDYPIKRPILAKSGCIISSNFATTYDTWTPERILARSEELIQNLFRKWELPIR